MTPLEVKHQESGWALGQSMTGPQWAVRSPAGRVWWTTTETEAWALLDKLAPAHDGGEAA
ncbi:MAG: hypothetical protein OEV62_00055 [Actinomycetota bacterium]|nr:hypothetical protein [Actinomycetota bacterium]